MQSTDRIQLALIKSPIFLNIWAVSAAFGTYFCMYMFRKPFTAASYEAAVLSDWDQKTILVSAQVIGYLISKLLGVRVVSEVSRSTRGVYLTQSLGFSMIGAERWMPFIAGMLFVIPLFFSVWMLVQIPAQSQRDITERSERNPMTRADRLGRAFPLLGFMVVVGAGLYLPFVAIHTTVFERMIALTRDRCNIGFLMYVVDSLGYFGYVAIMIFRNFMPKAEGSSATQILSGFRWACWISVVISLVFTVIAAVYFSRIKTIQTQSREWLDVEQPESMPA